MVTDGEKERLGGCTRWPLLSRRSRKEGHLFSEDDTTEDEASKNREKIVSTVVLILERKWMWYQVQRGIRSLDPMLKKKT